LEPNLPATGFAMLFQDVETLNQLNLPDCQINDGLIMYLSHSLRFGKYRFNNMLEK